MSNLLFQKKHNSTLKTTQYIFVLQKLLDTQFTYNCEPRILEYDANSL